jgi:PAS domain S-box-containing protein
MPNYSLICRDRRGAVVQRFDFAAPQDEEAQLIAESEAKGRAAELWSGSQRIAAWGAETQARRLEGIRSRLQPGLPVPEAAAVIATTPVGTVAFWDENAAALYGWRPEEAIGRDIIELTPAVQSRHTASDIMKTLQEGRGWAGEIVLRRKDGRPFRGFVLDVPVRDAAGVLDAIVGVSMPIDQADEILARRAEIEAVIAGRFAPAGAPGGVA